MKKIVIHNKIRWKNIGKLMSMGLFLLFLYGCSKDAMTLEQNKNSRIEQADLEAIDEAIELEADADVAEDSAKQEHSKSMQMQTKVAVYVCGAVEYPGVYELDADSRICDAIRLAGGMKADASPICVNQAGFVEDGQMIHVLTVEEYEMNQVTQVEVSDGTVNINTATKEQLMTLPGIGESKADSIIAYRENQGEFSAVEDIMQIEGIKEGVYAKIKERIAVN